MSKIQIRGIIVPSMLDDEIFDDEIQKGIITPLSRVEKLLDEANTNEPLELYINSQGGSVFAGHEMKNKIVEWRQQTGQSVNVTVGAMSASAASTLAVMLGPVRAHRNAMFMFHSARSAQIGGPEAMEDMQKLLSEINGQVMKELTTRYSFDTDQVAEWFREERMGWVNAQDAQKNGLVSEIINEDGQLLTLDSNKQTQMEQRAGMKLAALVEPNQKEHTGMETQELAQLLGFEKPDEATEEQVKEALQNAQHAKKQAADDAYSEGYEAGKQENFATRESELKEQHKQEVEKVTQERDTEKQSREQAERQLKAVQNERDKAHQRITQLDRGFQFDGSGDDPDSGDATADQYWQEVDRLVKDEGCSEEQAQLRAKDTHSEAYQKMIDEANAK